MKQSLRKVVLGFLSSIFLIQACQTPNIINTDFNFNNKNSFSTKATTILPIPYNYSGITNTHYQHVYDGTPIYEQGSSEGTSLEINKDSNGRIYIKAINYVDTIISYLPTSVTSLKTGDVINFSLEDVPNVSNGYNCQSNTGASVYESHGSFINYGGSTVIPLNSGQFILTVLENQITIKLASPLMGLSLYRQDDCSILTRNSFNLFNIESTFDIPIITPSPTPTPTATPTSTPTPQPSPSIDNSQDDNENLSEDDLNKLQSALFPECKSFSTKSIDLGKGPTCGGKLGNLGYIYDLIDLAGQIIEANAEDNLNEAAKSSLDAVTKSQILKLQRIVGKIRNGMKEVDSIRNEFRIGTGRNIATIKGSLNGENIDLIGVSGKGNGVSNNSNISGSTTKDKLVNIDNLKDNRILHPQNNKDLDSEAKVLEKIAQDLEKNPNIKGKLDLFSERKPCKESCNDLIKEFQSKYGDRVKLNVLYGPRK